MKTPLLITVLALLFSFGSAKAMYSGPGGHHHLNKDSVAKAHKMVLGLWVDTQHKGHTFEFKQDSVTETRPADADTGTHDYVFTNEYQFDSTSAKITIFTEDDNGNSVEWLYVVSVNDKYMRIAHDARGYKTRQYLEVYKREVKQ